MRNNKGQFVKGSKQGFQKGNRIGVGNKYCVGKKLTPEHKEKIRQGNLGKEYSLDTRKKISLAKKGNKSHFWKGGISTDNEKFRRSAIYKIWRKAVFERDNYTCVFCRKKFIKGVTGDIELNADHIKPFAHYPELRLAIDNGRTLCVDCHRKTDSWGRRTK